MILMPDGVVAIPEPAANANGIALMSFGWSWHALFVVGFANCVREHPSVGAWALPLGVFTFEASLLLWVVELQG